MVASNLSKVSEFLILDEKLNKSSNSLTILDK